HSAKVSTPRAFNRCESASSRWLYETWFRRGWLAPATRWTQASSWRVSRSGDGNPRSMSDAANWSDDNTERVTHEAPADALGEGEREAEEQAKRAREAAKRVEVDPDPDPDD